jgi:hypothetical protein
MAAALVAAAPVFSMRLSPAATRNAYVTQLRLRWVCITAFTTPISVTGRRLAIIRGMPTATPSGGTALNAGGGEIADPPSFFNALAGGDMRIATTATLTFTGSFETQEFESALVATLGTAGATQVFERRWDSPGSHPIVLIPGQALVVRNQVLMEAAGTWNLGVDVEWYEL